MSLNRLERHALGWLQRRCPHPEAEVVADILQRDNLPTVVRWCASCGAVGVGIDGSYGALERPYPRWLPWSTEEQT